MPKESAKPTPGSSMLRAHLEAIYLDRTRTDYRPNEFFAAMDLLREAESQRKDLLEALKLASNDERLQQSGQDDYVLGMARAAIAKAEGQ